MLKVDGQGNDKLASVHFENFPIHCAKFNQNGSEFIVGSSSNSHFFTYDMMEGVTTKVATHHNLEMTNMKVSLLFQYDNTVRIHFGWLIAMEIFIHSFFILLLKLYQLFPMMCLYKSL